MKQTIISTLSNREPADEFRLTVAALQSLGAVYQKCPGWSDVAEGRCVQLSSAVEVVRENKYGERDIVLVMDDDMAIQPSDVQELINEARHSGIACAAVYPTAEVKEQRGRIAGCQLKGVPGRWLTGLGCLAIPVPALLELERESEKFELRGASITEYTWACAERGEWYSEDYRLCLRLGGVRLLPIPCGHKKPIVLWPDTETLEEVRQINAAASNGG